MSLRELPPEQEVSPRRWRRLRYVPLTILVVMVVAAAVLGYSVSHRQAEKAAATAPVAASPRPSASRAHSALPEICHPAVDATAREPWIGSAAAASEKTWTDHAAAVSSAVIDGEDGWADWGDVQAQNLSHVVGRRLLTNAELQRWHDYFSGIQSALTAQGIPFYIVITPAKFDVYPGKLPEWARELRGSTDLDQLLADAPDLPVVDTRQTLRNASTKHYVFSRVNSHWTLYGAYVAWQQIAECIDASAPGVARISVPKISGTTTGPAPNEYASYGVPDADDWTAPDYVGPLSPVVITDSKGSSTVSGDTSVRLDDLPVTTSTPGARQSSALVLRDSFGDALSTLLDQAFSTTWQVRHELDMGPGHQADVVALAAKDHPDVVIYQLAARYLTFPPG